MFLIVFPRRKTFNLSLFQSFQQPQRDAVLARAQGDEVGRDAHDRRPRLSHLQRPSLHRKHHGALQPELQAAHRDLQPTRHHQQFRKHLHLHNLRRQVSATAGQIPAPHLPLHLGGQICLQPVRVHQV